MEVSKAVAIFSALAGESRLQALRLLISAGPTGLPAGDIADRLGIPASTTSFHLSALERAGLTQATRQGRQIIHAVRIAVLRDMMVFLSETCCGDHPELCGDLARLLPDIPEENVPMAPAFNVLFLCTRNSARSMLAEAILDGVGGGRFRAYSDGSDPAAAPMPEVIDRIAALGHDVSRLHAKSWDTFVGPDAPQMDFVIALCDTLHGQACPEFGKTAITAAWPLPDPAQFTGSPVQRTVMLNELYASLRRRIEIFANLPFESLDRFALKARLDEIGGGTVAALERGQAR